MALLDFMPMYIRLGISFASDYFHQHAGSIYSQEIMDDPIKRHNQKMNELKHINATYPHFAIGSYKIVGPTLGIGVPTIPKVWGCKIQYAPHLDPVAVSLLSKNDNPLDLKLPNVDDGIQWLLSEVDEFVEAGYKKETFNLPDLQGPLNVAMKLVGDGRMLSLIARKNKADVVEYILDKSAEMYIEVKKRLLEATGQKKNSAYTISGCTYYYLRPAQWTKFILPVIDRTIAEFGPMIRLHHCGEANKDQLDAYSAVDWLGVEFGFGSDLKHAREIFDTPKTGPLDLSCRISPYRMLNQTPEQIKMDVQTIIDGVQGGPASIGLVGCPNDVPIENLNALWDAVQDYIKKKEEEEDDDW